MLTVGDLLDAAESERLTLTARLVVLSACETGAGATSATEGVLGLQRAFLALGAETLLVSLWKVEDAATRALIGAFYRHWLDDADGPSAAESLRRAQSDLRNGTAPNWQPAWTRPNAWAAFQVVGAGDRQRALSRAAKTVQLFVLERETGAPRLQTLERPVLASHVTVEHSASTQPFSSLPRFSLSSFAAAQVFGITAADRGARARKWSRCEAMTF